MKWLNIEREKPPANTDILIANLFFRKKDLQMNCRFVILAKSLKDQWFDSFTGRNLTEEIPKIGITHWCHIPHFPILKAVDGKGEDWNGKERT